MQPAKWWEAMDNGKLHCFLFPRHCHIGEGQTGFCFIRKNLGGTLYNLGYGHPAAVQIDPIEKKPLFHFLPGSSIFSLGTAGCNMGCLFCQNWDISKSRADQVRAIRLEPEQVVRAAIEYGCPSIAFTYNEPTIWGEYVIDIAEVAHRHGLNTVMVTNGYITREAFHDIYDNIDAANVDLKAFSEHFYSKITLSHLQPVLEMLTWLKRETKVWVEITNLLIPTLNDRMEEVTELARWIHDNLGDDVPLHVTAFHPDFKLRDKPPTPPATLRNAREAALQAGLKFVYEGNILSPGANTFCPNCHEMLVRRRWNAIEDYRISKGCCEHCGERLPGVFSAEDVQARFGRSPMRPDASRLAPLPGSLSAVNILPAPSASLSAKQAN